MDRYLDDYEAGRTYEPGDFSLTQEEMIEFADFTPSSG